MKIRETAGGVLLFSGERSDNQTPGVLLIDCRKDAHDLLITKSFPKGGLHMIGRKGMKRPEPPIAAARREIFEEAGIDGTRLHLCCDDPLITYDRMGASNGSATIAKRISLFLFTSDKRHPESQKKDRHPAANWVSLETPLVELWHREDREAYAEILPTLRAVALLLQERKEKIRMECDTIMQLKYK